MLYQDNYMTFSSDLLALEGRKR